jgi:poly-gamma-glutamate synthesis protein (capsule biosynthesis protein)
MHLFRGADIFFCNLETVVADKAYLSPGDHHHGPRTDEWMFASYLKAGVNVMNMANNPSMYHGVEGIARSLDVLDAAGVVHGGAGRNITEARRPAIIERNGTRVAFVCRASVVAENCAATGSRPGIAHFRVATAYETSPRVHQAPGFAAIVHTIPNAADRADLAEDIALARTQADVVVVSWHWGLSPISGGAGQLVGYQTEMGRFAIDAGADMVIGHHPHLLQPIEVYRGKVIAYSLANYVHDLESFRPGRKLTTMLLQCLIRDGAIHQVSYIPGRIDGHGPPVFCSPAEGADIVEHMRSISEPLGAKFTVGEDEVQVGLGH